MPAADLRILRRLYLVASIATVLASFVALAAREHWILDLFSHFRLQYFVVALLLLLLRPRRGNLRWLLLLALIPNGWMLYPYVPRGVPVVAQNETPVSVLNANVFGRVGNPNDLLNIIATEKPDLVLIVELTERFAADLVSLTRTHPHQLLAAASDARGIGLYSALPLSDEDVLNSSQSYALRAIVETESGRFEFVAVHPRAPVTARLAALRNDEFAEVARLPREPGLPRLLCGDFNSTPFSPWFRQLEEESGLVDLRRGHGPGLSWPSFFVPAGIAIDHCLGDERVRARSIRKLGNIGSDHYPQLFDILLEAAR